MKIFAQPLPFCGGVGLYIKDGDSFVKSLVMEKCEPGRMIDQAITLEPNQSQFLIDQLWSCGYRPTEGTGSLAATERHLADMRKIVFHQLEIE